MAKDSDSGLGGFMLGVFLWVVSFVVSYFIATSFDDTKRLLGIVISALVGILGLIIVEFYNSRKSKMELSNKIESLHNDISAQTLIIRALSESKGITRLGDINSAIRKLLPLLMDSHKIRDITFRPDCLEVEHYNQGISIWVKAVYELIDKISVYELVVCKTTMDYPSIFLNNKIRSIDKIPKNIHIRQIDSDVIVAYPNFLIFYTANGKYLVIGWPYGRGTEGDIFLIDNQQVVEYFDRIYKSVWDVAKPYNHKPNNIMPQQLKM